MEIYIGKNGQQLGPYSKDALIGAYSNGEISLTDMAWSDGEPGWVALSEYAVKKDFGLPVKSAATVIPPIPHAIAGQPALRVESLENLCCPKCKSEHVQKISIIVEQGTSEINTQSSSAGIGVGFGGIAVGGAKTATSGTAQNQLAKQFSEELYAESNVLQGLFSLVSLAIGVFIGFNVGGFFHSSFMGWASGIVAFVGLGYVGMTYLFQPSDETIKLQEKKNLWKESGFYCNRCAAKFVPGSGEIYSFSEQ